MGKTSKRLLKFIENIPDEKLVGLSDTEHTLYTTKDFRIDMQGVSATNPNLDPWIWLTDLMI